MILVIVSPFFVISTLQLPPKVMAQAPSEGAKVLIDDAIQDLKANDTEKAQVHLSILNQQLSTFINSTSIQTVKVLLYDANIGAGRRDANENSIGSGLSIWQLI
jgi:hypothetical protein